MAGAIGIGMLLARFGLKQVLVISFFLTTTLMVLFAVVPTNLAFSYAVSMLIGMVACSSMAGLYALATGAYEASVRSTAVGLGVTVGRAGAIVAPAVAGTLVDLNWSSAGLYLLMAPTFLVAGLLVALIRIKPTNTAPLKPTTQPSTDATSFANKYE